MNPLLYVDSYKTQHHLMYPKGTTMIYSNFTPRKSRMKGVNEVVVFGIQHFVLEYLIKKFNKEFFNTDTREASKELLAKMHIQTVNALDDASLTFKKKVIEQYKKHTRVEDTKHIEALWDLGYLPIEIKALPEGTRCPIGVPCLTIKNTHPNFAWLTNYLETLLSCMLWQPMTSATIAYEYKKLLSKYAIETTGSAEFVQWQGHDFSMRGMSSVESAILSGMGHLTSFTGTDTIPAIYQLEDSYDAKGLIGASVPATEHSVMCMGTKEDEIGTFKELLDKYPTGILSVVSDTWDLWKVLTEYLPALKDQIMKRDGKLVIRPDSGNPVDIICGINSSEEYDSWDYDEYVNQYTSKKIHRVTKAEYKGVIELLWDIFGGKINEYGYKVLDSHIGAIYGDSITLDRAHDICERLKAKGFASTNIVLGIGSYTYQYNTRDTFGFAMKATAGKIKIPCKCITEACNGSCEPLREIFKDPVTDDGTKKSKKGLLQVFKNAKEDISDGDNYILCKDQCTWEDENKGLLETVFLNGKLIKRTTLEEIRERLKAN